MNAITHPSRPQQLSKCLHSRPLQTASPPRHSTSQLEFTFQETATCASDERLWTEFCQEGHTTREEGTCCQMSCRPALCNSTSSKLPVQLQGQVCTCPATKGSPAAQLQHCLVHDGPPSGSNTSRDAFTTSSSSRKYSLFLGQCRWIVVRWHRPGTLKLASLP